MAEENTVTRTVENVDRLFSEIVVNGESHVSERYVAPEPETAPAVTPEPEVSEPSSDTPSQQTVQGQDVYAVELNDVLHNFVDRAVTQGLANEVTARQSADQNLANNILLETTARQNADNTLQGNIDALARRVTTNEGDISDIKEDIVLVKADISDIEALIPNQASDQNQLADKEFVNSSISTNTANFLGTYTSLADIEAIQNPTNNDYAFLQTTDSAGNTQFDRYKYSSADSQWHYEYTLNNSSFTAEQWATINSGLTQSSVEGDISDAIAEEVTNRNTAISTAVGAEATARDTAIANAITSLLAKIATQFSSSAVYTKDTYVSYEGSIYRCVNNHTGAWSAGDFTEVNLANDLMQIIKSMSGGSSIDMNEIAELFDIDKNSEFVGKLIPYNGNVVRLRIFGDLSNNKILTDVSDIVRGIDFCIFKLRNNNSSMVSQVYADLAKGILYVKSLTSTGCISFGYVTLYVNSYQAQMSEALTGADITSVAYVSQQFNLNNVMSTCCDSRRVLALIYNGYVYWSEGNPTFSQSIAGNRIICVNNLFVISSANGIYTTYGMSWSPVQKSSLSASHICFGKNKFAMLHSNTVYYSNDLSTWLATTMTGVTELYFSCNKFVARDSSGHIYYSEDLEEWKQSPIVTTSGVFLDTVFTWGTNYTRDFINVQIISSSMNYYTPRMIKGSTSYVDVSGDMVIGLTDLCAVTYAINTSSGQNDKLFYLASPVIAGGGSAIRFPLN